MSLEKGSPCPAAGVLARYIVTKHSSWRGKYHRLFALLEGALINVDPSNWTITNLWRYDSDLVEFGPSVSSDTEFRVTVRNGRRNEVLQFGCERRSDLLTDLARIAFGRRSGASTPFPGLKVTRAAARVSCTLEVRSYGIAQISPEGEELSVWSMREIQSIQTVSDDASAVVVEAHGRGHLFALRDVAGFMAAASALATKLGRTGAVGGSTVSVTDYRTARVKHGNDGASTIAEFHVTKLTSRHPTPRSRRLVLTDTRLTERDSASYQVVSSRKYGAILAVVRHEAEPQHVTIQYRDGSHRTYISPRRDGLVAGLIDCLRVSGGQPLAVALPVPINDADAMVQPPLRVTGPVHTARGSSRGASAAAAAGAVPSSGLAHAMAPPHPAGPGELDPVVERFMLAHLESAGRAVMTGAGGSDSALIRAAEVFCACVEPLGIASDTGRGKFGQAMSALLGRAAAGAKAGDSRPASETAACLGALYRIAGAHAAWKALGTAAEIVPLVLECLRHGDPTVSTAALSLLRRLCRNSRPPARPDGDGEVNARRVLLREDMREALADMLDHYTSGAAAALGSSGTLVLLELVRLLDAVLVSAADTTPSEVGEHLMQLVAARYMALLALFRLKVPTVIECAAMLMRGIIHQADVETCRLMQRASLSTGILLRHYFNTIFAASPDQRFVSRYLVEVWCAGNPTARTLFRHMLPPGLLVYLESPKLSSNELLAMEALEAHLVDGGGASAAAAGTSAPDASHSAASRSGLASRLRNRLEAADNSALNKVKRRLEKLAEAKDGRRRVPFFGRRSVEQKRREAEEAERAAQAALAAEAEIVSGKMKQDGGVENFPIFFHMIMQDHDLPDLIWNAQTRGELRAALEAEVREIEREIELGGTVEEDSEGTISNRSASARDRSATASSTDAAAAAAAAASAADSAGTPGADGTGEDAEGGSKAAAKPKMQFAWNYSEFEVTYPSLREELRVGDQYLRVFLKGGRRAVADLRDPSNFFDALYRRVLRERAPSLRGMCLRGMSLVYEQHWKTIGPFEDTDYIMWLISEEAHNAVRDRLLLLAQALALHPINCEKMINGDCIELVVDLMTTAHTMDVDRRVTPQLKVGAGLLLRDATTDEADALRSAAEAGAASAGAPHSSSMPRKTTAKVWHYRADPRDLAEGEKPEQGPFSLQDMQVLGQQRRLKRSSLVWAAGMREWVRLDSLRALMWLALSPGDPDLTPTERGLLCSKLLLRLVRLRPSVDGEGVPVRPVPMAKRVLSSARCMPHIAQALLTGDPDIVDTCTDLICDIVAFNPAATVKLYTTGIFFFALGYGGSNFEKIAQLLYISHLRQSFFSEAASLGRETTLARRSILGSLLPESMICVLENRGPKAFAEAFLSNVDTPEVVWKYEMRAHVLDMVGQHIGELPSRLHANPATVYDYCPIPRVTYEALDKEMWCANFYLGNLTDEVRFPDWPIEDPVLLLRALLDTWREEMSKEGQEAVSLDTAYAQLGVTADADEKTIRKAYRKLAMKFHPDKNPAGRDTFEKIQAAYEALTASRPEVAAGGPDPLALLLVVRCQCILFKRCAAVIKEYKYAGYPAIMQGLEEINPTDPLTTEGAGRMTEALTRLIYLTCLTSPRNSDELIRESGVETLLRLLGRATRELDPREEAGAVDLPPPDSGPKLGLRVLENVLHTLSGLAAMPDGRARFEADVASWAPAMVSALRFHRAPAAMKYALDAISRLSTSAAVQDALIDAGVIWRLIPLLFRFDVTLERETSEAAATDNAQKAANLHAKMAVRAIGRLGGYLGDKQSTPDNARVRAAMGSLLTPVLALRLGRAKPDALLASLVGHEESPTVMWNSDMRKELAAFVKARIDEVDATGNANMTAAAAFRYSTVSDELCIEGLYVRHFVADPKMSLESPFRLAIAIMRHVAYSSATPRVSLPGLDAKGEPLTGAEAEGLDEKVVSAIRDTQGVPLEMAMRHVRLALRALHLLVVGVSGVDDEIAGNGRPFLPSLYAALNADDGGVTDEAVRHRAAGSSARGAAGTGRSAGAGGARSSAAASDAPLRELVMTVVAAASTSEAFCRSTAELHQIPPLLRELPNDPVGVGPVLRTMLTHSCAVAELRRVGAIVDILILFAGGTASGPAPGQPGGPSIHEAPRLTVPRQAREEAGALLSAMCSNSTEGPPNMMNLTQLVPPAMARAIKESVSGATLAGGPTVGSAGAGVGAQGAGGGGGLGQAVRLFDGDHETPELIWDVVCRHELRATLLELEKGLKGRRTKAERAQAAGGFNGCPWTMPSSFSIKYTPIKGELCVGGIFVRLFVKEPTYPLRDPKGFLEACLNRLQQECDALIGLTSDDPEAVARAVKAAEAEAKTEAAAGGLQVGGSGGQAMVVRGEDVMTQVTHAVVCLLRNRPSFCDHVATLGFIPKLVKFVRQAGSNKARYNIGVQCIRVIEVVASNTTCVAQLSKQRAVETLIASVTPPHRDTAFTLEAVKKLLEADTAGATPEHALIAAAMGCGAIAYLVRILEKEKIDHLVDASGAKVHAVTILKLMEADPIHGAACSAKLAEHGAEWSRYKHQKHDMFLSRSGRADYFLSDVDTGPSRLIKNAPEYGGPSPAAAAAAASGRAPPAGAAAAALMLTDDTVPPPVPSRDPSYRGPSMGGFQAPAPAPVERPSGFGGFQAPAPAEPGSPAARRAPAPAAAAASHDPFADMMGSAPAPAPAPARTPAPARSDDPFAGMGSAPAPAPAAGRARAPSDDPFGDVFSSGPAPMPAPAPAPTSSGAGGDMFAGMSTGPSPTARTPAPAPVPAPAPPADDDPFAGLLD